VSEVVLDGSSLSVSDVVAIAGGAKVRLEAAARDRAAAAWRAAEAATRHGAVYGGTTDVGKAKGRNLTAGERADGATLLRQHAFAVGDPLPPDVCRAALAVRLNQLAAGGGGCRPEVLDALGQLLSGERLPVVRGGASLGTGDLAQLAAVGLALTERATLDRHDALVLMSSSAFTFAAAALAWHRLDDWIVACTAVGAASVRALDADLGFLDPVAPLQAGAEVATAMRGLIAGTTWPARSVQAAYGVRCLPQVLGALDEAAGHLLAVVTEEMNTAAENPLIDTASTRALHHGGFHQVRLALATDWSRAALHQAASLSAARLAELLDPDASGWPAGHGQLTGSHRLLGLEYLTHAALAHLRQAAHPVTLGAAVLAGGAEPHAPFAPEGVARLTVAVDAAGDVLACELAAAAAAIREKGIAPPAALSPLLPMAPGATEPVRDEVQAARERLAAARAMVREGRRRTPGPGAPTDRGRRSSPPAPPG